jgi:hypothetical protein
MLGLVVLLTLGLTHLPRKTFSHLWPVGVELIELSHVLSRIIYPAHLVFWGIR